MESASSSPQTSAVVAPQQAPLQPVVHPRTNAPPVCLSRSAVATLQTALALVVVRQRHMQRRRRDDSDSPNHTAGKRRRPTAAPRVPAVEEPLALQTAAAHRVAAQVHYLWAAALDEVVATARRGCGAAGNASRSPPVLSAALTQHLRTAWHTWLQRDKDAARAGVGATFRSRTTSTSTTAALWTALLVRPRDEHHHADHDDHDNKHSRLARVVYESVDDLVRTSSLWIMTTPDNHIEEDQEEENDSLAHRLPLLPVWHTARDILSRVPMTPMDDRMSHDDHPRRGLLPGDLSHAWASQSGHWTDRVDALWLHHAWGVAARPS
jgi:hypothetical protein